VELRPGGLQEVIERFTFQVRLGHCNINQPEGAKCILAPNVNLSNGSSEVTLNYW